MPAGPMFAVDLSTEGDARLVRLSGELDLATAPDLRDALAAVLEERPQRVLVDASQLSFCDSTGLSVLIGADRRARDQGGTLLLRSPSDALRRLLELSGVSSVLQIEP